MAGDFPCVGRLRLLLERRGRHRRFADRHFHLTGEPTARNLALDVRRMVLPPPRSMPRPQLPRLPGVGEFLLDMAQLSGIEDAEQEAPEIPRTIYAQRADRWVVRFGMLFPDDDDFGGANPMTGWSGLASFLRRLTRSKPRPLMLDELSPGGG